MADVIQLCTVDDLTGEEPCPRLARWSWQPYPDRDPVFLCNFHAEPFEPLPREISYDV